MRINFLRREILRFRRIVPVIILIVLIGTLAPASYGQLKYPTKPIEVYIQASPGSGVDLMARQVGKFSKKYLNQPLVPITKTGGDSAEQQNVIRSAPPDGYTIGTLASTTVGAWNTTLKGKFSMDQFEFISGIQTEYFILVVNATSPFQSLKEMVEWAKANPMKLRAAGYGKASGHHISFGLLAKAGHFTYSWVPFPGSPLSVAALLGGNLDVVCTNPLNAMQHVQAGKLRLLGILSSSRSPALPDLPTVAELGYPLEAYISQCRGFFTRKGVPKEIIQTLHAAFMKIVAEPEFKEYMRAAYLEELSLGPEEFTKYIQGYNLLVQESLRVQGKGGK